MSEQQKSDEVKKEIDGLFIPKSKALCLVDTFGNAVLRTQSGEDMFGGFHYETSLSLNKPLNNPLNDCLYLCEHLAFPPNVEEAKATHKRLYAILVGVYQGGFEVEEKETKEAKAELARAREKEQKAETLKSYFEKKHLEEFSERKQAEEKLAEANRESAKLREKIKKLEEELNEYRCN